MHEEKQYLSLIEYIINNGTKKDDRTGTGTISITGASMRYSLKDDILPLLTTKRVPFNAVLHELLFFVKGQTDNKILTDNKVNIWVGNSTKEFFEKNNIKREAGDLGPVYGFQWRHFGAEYKTSADDYTGQGIDQLQNIINEIKRNKSSRRLVVSGWNPMDLQQMALPPCHLLFQFVIREDYLDCILYQRSADMGLGVPFNIASYSLLAYTIANICDLKPGEFIHFIGDAHVYSNHVDALMVQIQREPKQFPKIKIKRKLESIDDVSFEDFELIDYVCHPKIVMEMAI